MIDTESSAPFHPLDLIPAPREMKIRQGRIDPRRLVMHAGSRTAASPAARVLASLLPSTTVAGVSPLPFHLQLDASSQLPAEGYKLDISPEGVRLTAHRPEGLFYGAQTLRQIARQSPKGWPYLSIVDWPDYPVRGFYHDVTRGKVPTLETLLALADKCAHYKLNHLELYVEHTYAFRHHRDVWAGSDPLTADEIRRLDEHCANLHIDLVPSFATFGHLYGWIRSPRKQHLNELEIEAARQPFNWWDRQMHYTLDCQNPESIQLIRELIEEVRPLFRSRYFNICGDETFDLGKGRNRDLAEEIGKGRLYVDFLKEIIAAVHEADAIPIFWGDIVRHHQDLIEEISPRSIILDWDYSDLSKSYAETLSQMGRSFYVCPGTNGWNRWFPDIETAHSNITRFARHGLAHGAAGLLNTDWGDCGHINCLSLSYHGLILGAAASWNSRSSILESTPFDAAFSRLELGDSSAKLASLLRQASSTCKTAWMILTFHLQPRSSDFPDAWFDPVSELPNGIFKHPASAHEEALETLERLAGEIEPLLETITPADPLAVDEIRVGLLGMRVMEELYLLCYHRAKRLHTGKIPSPKEVADRLRDLDTQLSHVWHLRNKPSEYYRIRQTLLSCAVEMDLHNQSASPDPCSALHKRTEW